MKRHLYIAALLLLVPTVALTPVARIAVDWLQVSRLISLDVIQPSIQGYDWVVWDDQDGIIVASYVFPLGPAAAAGLQRGDVFFELNYQQFFNAADLRVAIARFPPGSMHTFSVLRDGAILDMNVRFTRYPTFLYPVSTAIWQFAIWGFLFGAFLHVLGIGILGPLGLRPGPARFGLLLILVSSLWFTANAVRLLTVELIGPPIFPGSIHDTIWQALTLVGLLGWIGFPALLLDKVLHDTGWLRTNRWPRIVLYVPATVLLLLAVLATLMGAAGPFTQTGLVTPILFHACWYIAVAAALVLVYHLRSTSLGDTLGGWNRTGSIITFVTALTAALAVTGVIPLPAENADRTWAWIVVCTQLLSLAPILLVTLANLKYGKVDQVVSRGLAYLAVLGLIFFAFVGGISLIDPYLEREGTRHYVVEGLYMVILLLVFDRIARSLRLRLTGFFATDRQRARQMLSRFQEHMRDIVSPELLMQQTVQVVGEAFGVRSAVLFLRPHGTASPWLSSAYHPEPPYLTERLLSLVWPFFEAEGKVWADNPELNESALPENLSQLISGRGGVLAIPIQGESKPIGLLILTAKKPRRAVYNLEDLDLLRVLGSQLALATERLNLIERERTLVRESAEAQLVALRAQINPHFLFNSLNTIISLIEETPEEAEETVEHLAAIFRHILQTSSCTFVTLEDELALVGHYLKIEQMRFGPKLTLEQRVEDSLLSFPVPAFAVQTLVENAVKHGLEKRRSGGTLRILCKHNDDGWAEITVEDTGVGIPSLFSQESTYTDDTSFFGIGLRNVSGRLEQIYRRGGLLRIVSKPGEGTSARLLLPPSPMEAPNPVKALSPVAARNPVQHGIS
jgi:two-component system, LytTR family, sensor kinase